MILVTLGALLGGSIMWLSLFVSKFVPWEVPHPRLIESFPIGFAVIVMLAVLAIVRRVAWKWIAFSSFVPLAFLAFLANDAPPFELPDLGPRVVSDDPGYQTMMWFGIGSPYSRLDELRGLDNEIAEQLPKDRAIWGEYVQAHKDSIEAAWSKLSLCREWAARIAEHPPRGVWHQVAEGPHLDYRPIRRLAYVTNAHAYLLASEGEATLGIEALVPELRAMYNLQRTGPTLVNGMIVAVSLKLDLAVAQAILDRAATSNRARAALRDALESAPKITDVMNNVFGGEIELSNSVVDGIGARWGVPSTSGPGAFLNTAATSISYDRFGRWVNAGTNVAGPFVFNRISTVQVYAGSMQELEALAVAKKFKELDGWNPHGTPWVQQLKNPVGRWIDAALIPAYERGIHGIWDAEELRIALLKRLREAEPEAISL